MRARASIRAAFMLAVCLLSAFLVLGQTAGAVEPDEILKDAALESRARAISQELRCLVCQNQSIDDSNAGLARDLRILVRERLTEGDSDAAVVAFVRARYGDFVLLRPPFGPATYALWLGPFLIFALGIAGAAVFLRRRRAIPEGAAPLSDEEKRRLRALLNDEAET